MCHTTSLKTTHSFEWFFHSYVYPLPLCSAFKSEFAAYELTNKFIYKAYGLTRPLNPVLVIGMIKNVFSLLFFLMSSLEEGRFHHALLRGIGRLEHLIAHDCKGCSPDWFKKRLKLGFIAFPQIRDEGYATSLGFVPARGGEFVKGKVPGVRSVMETKGGFEAIASGRFFDPGVTKGFDYESFIDAKVSYNNDRIDDLVSTNEFYGIQANDWTTIFPHPDYLEARVDGGVVDKLESWPWGLRVVDYKTRMPSQKYLAGVVERLYDYVAALKKKGINVFEHEAVITTLMQGDDYVFEDHAFKVPGDELSWRLRE